MLLQLCLIGEFADHIRVHRNSNLESAVSLREWILWRQIFLSNVSRSVDDADWPDNTGPMGCVWTDKLEMVNTVARSIREPAVLFQVDADELWTPQAIVGAYRMLQAAKSANETQGGGSCIRTHAHFFVAPGLVTVTPNGYGHSTSYEWTRVWNFAPSDMFVDSAFISISVLRTLVIFEIA